jgi:hypothetical protein
MSKLGRQRPCAIVPRSTRRAAGRLRVRAAILLRCGGPSAAIPPRPAPAAPLNHWGVLVPAHYYIWCDPSSSDRTKIDVPALRPSSSDNPAVRRQQVAWAKQPCIDGFIVSWKSTPTLNRRLPRSSATALRTILNSPRRSGSAGAGWECRSCEPVAGSPGGGGSANVCPRRGLICAGTTIQLRKQ